MAGHGGGGGADSAPIGSAPVGAASQGVGGGQEHVQAVAATKAIAALATGAPELDRAPGTGKGGGG